MILNAATNSVPQYSLQCINLSAVNWYFYIYQRTPRQAPDNIFSVVWMASPFKVGNNSFVTFKWSANICFAWFLTSSLRAGVSPAMGGTVSATKNGATFDILNNTPQFLDFVSHALPDEYSILGGTSIPNNVFSTGIGMSDFGILIQQSLVNVNQIFSSDTAYWVAATNSYVQVGDVLPQETISNSSTFAFPLNVYEMTATLGQNNLWSII